LVVSLGDRVTSRARNTSTDIAIVCTVAGIAPRAGWFAFRLSHGGGVGDLLAGAEVAVLFVLEVGVCAAIGGLGVLEDIVLADRRLVSGFASG
jgi:hypothetical protein